MSAVYSQQPSTRFLAHGDGYRTEVMHSSSDSQWSLSILVVLVQLFKQGGASSGAVGEAGGVR